MTLIRTERLLDPDMPADELLLHMGEMTAQEVRTARAAIGWANSRASGILSAPVGVQELEWREIEQARGLEDPTTEPTGDYEATTPFGPYYIEMYFGSDSYGWAATFDGVPVASGDKNCPDKAKAAAQADYERRVLSCLTEQSGSETVTDHHLTFDLDRSGDFPTEAHHRQGRQLYNVIDWAGMHRGQIALTADEAYALKPLRPALSHPEGER